MSGQQARQIMCLLSRGTFYQGKAMEMDECHIATTEHHLKSSNGRVNSSREETGNPSTNSYRHSSKAGEFLEGNQRLVPKELYPHVEIWCIEVHWDAGEIVYEGTQFLVDER